MGAKIFGFVEAAIAITAGLSALWFVIYHRNDQILVESQPVFMAILALGCILMAISIVALTLETDAGCILYPWLFFMGIVLSLSSLTAKSARVAILWYGRGPIVERNRYARARVLLFGIVVAMTILIALLIAWQITAPWTLVLVTLQTDGFHNPL